MAVVTRMGLSPFIIRMDRPDPSREWGFRLHGGRDVGAALTLTKVVPKSLADQHGLCVGDYVVSIGGDATSTMTHMQAQQAVIRCGNELELAIVRSRDSVSSNRYSGTFTSPVKTSPSWREPLAAQMLFTSSTPSSPSVPTRHTPTYSQPSFFDGENLQNGNAYSKPLQRNPSFRTHAVVNISKKGAPSHAQLHYQEPHRLPEIVVQPMKENRLNKSSAEPEMIPRHYSPVQSQHRQPSYAMNAATLPARSRSTMQSAPSTANPTFDHRSKSTCETPVKMASWKPQQTPAGMKSDKKGPRRVHPTNVHLKNSPPKNSVAVCAACQIVIRGPFMAALEYTFCPEHFTCAHCSCRLDNLGFVEENGQLYCENDYAAFLAPRCEKCRGPVVGEVTTALSKKWHPTCFTCSHCYKTLSEVTFRVGDDGRPYCEEDWNQLFSMKCDKCGQAIDPIDRYIEAFQKVFHAACFRCAACQISLDGKPFHSRDGKAFCKTHARAAALY